MPEPADDYRQLRHRKTRLKGFKDTPQAVVNNDCYGSLRVTTTNSVLFVCPAYHVSFIMVGNRT